MRLPNGPPAFPLILPIAPEISPLRCCCSRRFGMCWKGCISEWNGKLLFTNIGEISYETGFYDYDTKYSSHSGVRILTSARISPEQGAAVLEYSRAIAQALGIKGLSRIDYLLDGNGEIYFNEINTFPGMTERSMFSRLIEAEGITLSELLEQLISEAVG